MTESDPNILVDLTTAASAFEAELIRESLESAGIPAFATTTVGTAGALVLQLGSFQSFLFLLGSLLVALFAVLLADWLCLL